MTLPQPKKSKPVLVMAAIGWAAIVTCRFLFYFELSDALWLLLGLVDAVVLLLPGAAIAVIALIGMIRKTVSLRHGYTTLAIAFAVFFLGWLTPVGANLGLYFRLWRNESEYLRQVQIASDPSQRTSLDRSTSVDEGPPVRVAFSWGGIMDNWIGIVHDPTGEVMEANRFRPDWSNWNDPALGGGKRLFGGDLYRARHLWGNWYFCCFT
jgi:hypothetical protein